MHIRKTSLIFIDLLILSLSGCSLSPRSVLTQHNNSMRTGAYLLEKQLTPAAVDSATGPGMVLQYLRPVNGNMTAQLLYTRGGWVRCSKTSSLAARFPARCRQVM